MDTPIRVLTITSEWPTPAHPDAVPFIVRQVEFVRRAGIEVDVFAFHGGRKPSNYFRAWRRLRPLLRDGRYDLIHAQFGQSGLLPWPKRHPLVVTFRGCDLLGVKYNLCMPPSQYMGVHGFSADPDFVDATRKCYWLQEASPAIGRAARAFAPAEDFWGRFGHPGLRRTWAHSPTTSA